MNQDEAKNVFKSYQEGYDTAKIRDQLNVGDEILNEVAAAIEENETAPPED